MIRVVLLFGLVGCASTIGAPYREQTPPETPARWLSWRASQEGRNLDEQRGWDEALGQGKRPALDLSDVDLARRANGLYQGFCAPCHGGPGDDSAIARHRRQVAQVPPLGGTGYRFGMMMGGDKMAAGVFKVIAEGRGQMPGFAGQMTNEQIWLMVEYLRGL